MAYIGKSPTGTGVRSRFYYTQTSGGGTSISGTDDNSKTLTFTDGEYIDVFLNGVLLVAGTDYNTNTANTISGLAALANGDVVEVVVYDIFTVADTVSASQGGTFNAAITANQVNADNIRIDGNTISSTDTNGDITLDPDGTGNVVVKTAAIGGTPQSDAGLVLEGTDSSRCDLQILGDDGAYQSIYFGDASDADIGSIAYSHSSNSMRFTTNTSERMRIDSSGRLLVGTTDTALYNNTSGQGLVFDAASGSTQMLRDGNVVLLINRASSDGTLVTFYQNGAAEGSISVSGSTVSYNGGHLARWSQLADNTKDTSIVKGTVMTNLDQMAEWTKDGVTEDNEQLNCMAVSSVEGDANVAGVFVNWDDDDEDFTADMNIAMTGDMVIRIAQGTTVARGDLLMSAGDGTAKPQGDDIVRSKTIAKVTSTNVSHTYDDGSYLVPCVLMAC